MSLDDIPPMTIRCATETHVITDANCPHCRIRELEAANAALKAALRIAGHYLTDVYLQNGDEYHGGLGAFRNTIDSLLAGSPSRPDNLSSGSALSDSADP